MKTSYLEVKIYFCEIFDTLEQCIPLDLANCEGFINKKKTLTKPQDSREAHT